MIKRLLILLLLIGATSFQGKASHLMGGEVTWECLPSGAFQFRMILYRDCNGVPGPGVASLITNAPAPGGSIPMALLSQTDVTPAGCGTSCAAPGPLGGNVEEFVFQSAPIFLTGVPPATGWYFTYDNCCRNAAIDNLVSPSSNGMTLRAWMYPYNGQNTNPCFDSSPLFVESPNTIICTGYTFTYNHNAQDPELDSLVYSWDIPLDDYFGIFNPPVNPAAVAWSGGYTTNSQLPGPLQNPLNTGASLDPNTGEVVYLSYTNGNFVTVVKVSAYKCGQLVAEIFREIQVVLLACPNLPNGMANQPPTVTAPFFDPITLGPLYTDTVTAGDSVWFFMSATDFELNAGGIPQTLTILGSGSQFGAGFTNPNAGCLNPPCAVVSPAFPISAPFGAGVNFGWQTDCAHLGFNQGCVSLSNTYTFVVRVQDDFCPAPGINVSTITIVVQAPPLVNEPEVRCAEVLPNGDVTLTWSTPIDTFNSFYQYQLYSDYLAPGSGAYTLVDTVQLFNQTSYTHVGANAQTNVVDYYIRTRSGCNKERFSDSTDARISTMNLTVSNIGNGVAGLSWNAMLNPPISSWANYYQIYKRTTNGAWNFVDSTMAITFNDTIQDICKDTLYYKIELRDSSGCVSVSSEDSATFINVLVPDPPDLRCIEVLANGNVQITWEPPADTASAFDGYFIYMDDGTGYTLIDSIFMYNTTSYTDVNANANAGNISYYMETRTLCNSQLSLPGNILQTMTLTVSNLPAGSATLNWNAYGTPAIPVTNQGWYYIYREFASNPGVWTLVDSVAVPTTNAVLPITDICVENINYRIEIEDASGCRSVSTIDGDLFSLILVPDPPELRCVAVNPNGTVTISWAPPADTASSFDGYFIYQANGGAYTLIDSLPGYGTTSYTDLTANANTNGMYTYYLSTLTSCARTFSTSSDTLQTMILTVNNAPAGTASLTWNSIHTPSLATTQNYYKIFMQNPCTTGPWMLLDSTMATNFSQAITNLTCLDDVCFRVEVGDAAGCNSVSTVDNAQFASTLVPDPPTVNCVVVLPNGNVNITYTPPLDTVLSFGGYFIYSSPTGLAGSFVLIDSVFNYFQTSYNHIGANAQTATVYYQIETRSGCSNTIYSAPTPTFQSIKLDVINAPLGTAALTWNSISNPLPAGSGAYYYIYKQQPAGAGPFVLIDSVAVPTTNFNDPIVNITCQDNINYQVQITGPGGCLSISSIDGDLFYDPSVPDPPDVRCVEVLANGDVIVTWLPPADTVLRFGGYFIYDGAGTVIDSIFNYNQLSYTVVGAGANTASVDYYMQTRSGCGSIFSAQSPTLSSIYLTAVNNGAGGAQLNWNAIANPALATTNATYDVYKQNPAVTGAWVLLTTTANTNYLDAINDVCQGNIDYRIEIGDASGCTSISNVDGDFFRSTLVPDPPDLRCVEVLASGDVVLTWLAPADTVLKFGGYFVYDGAGTLIDSIFNYAQNNYTVVGANAGTASRDYYMTTLSGCDRIFSVPSPTLASMYLTAVNNGAGGAQLNWNAIANPPLATTNATYDVYKQNPAGTGAWVLLTTTANTNYLDVINDVCQGSIDYRIEIGDASGCTSISNVDGDFFRSQAVPDAPDLRCVEVLANGDVVLTWLAPADTVLKFGGYFVYDGAGTLVDSIFNYAQNNYTVVGANGNTGSRSYYMQTLSGCDRIFSIPSPTLSSIYLTAVNNGAGTGVLNWNPIATPALATTNGTYDVYKQYPAGAPWVLLTSTANTNFNDIIVGVCQDSINYRIEIGDASGCTSISNVDGDWFKSLEVPEAPSVRCINVDPSGDVTLSWVAPLDTGLKFNSYQVYTAATLNGPYTLHDSIFNYNQTSYAHLGANAQVNDVYYFMTTKTGCSENFSPNSDSIRSMRMTATNNGFGSANLNWNDIHNPKLPTSSGNFDIYRQVPAGTGPWNLLATTTNLNYFDSINDICSEFVAYRVEQDDASGCISVSTIDQVLIENLNKPESPDLRCVSVLPGGDIELTWIPPVDTTLRYNSYHVYSSVDGINFSVVDSIFNYAQTTYTHTGVNGQNQSVYYYMETRSGCGVRYSDPSQTIRSIKLDVNNGGGFAQLAWNDIANPRPNTSASFYNVYQEYPAGVWTLIDTVNGNNYLDTITICSAVINYRVEIGDDQGCISVSSIDGDLFEDIIRPNPPLMDTVSVDVATHNVHISWNPSTSGDTEWYIVRQFNGTSWDSIGFTFGINSTYFLNVNANPGAGFERYRVQSVDSCGNRSFSPPAHRTIFAEVTFDKCDESMTIDWTEYINMEDGIDEYQIFTSEDNQPFTLLGSVPSGQLSYKHTGLNDGSFYCYYVKAIGNIPSKSSTSNKTDTLEADLLTDPEFAYLNKATVITNSIVYVECLVDTAADISYYKLVRSDRYGGPFITVSVNNNVTDPNITFFDYNAYPDQTSHYYLVVAVNPCGEDVFTSNYGRTIHLTAKPENTLRNVLKWNNYGDWLAGVQFYHIFRNINGVWDPNPIANVPFGVREFVDDVSDFYKLDGNFGYYVEAVEDFGNTLGFRDTSRSNVAQAVQAPWVYIPNAFTPGGKNPVFNPLSSFTSAADYNMQIFNKWGEKLFETDNPNIGWDGSFDSEIAPQGAYVYLIKVEGFDGTFIERTGTVTLLR